ncbi:hypothetical protein BJP36_43220 [Moorena producens JHB]|uniref:Uncharacterized protein n=1 Tax=Moorena producens (strain JHB) TaxID=1454205 RepID=A0A9Q9ST54_MOOP1|nr:hypothetical protein [Moorena producens]WAN69173.1 hypothetical protein BJP36_43220 [Moorena producens JHB]
MIVITAVIKFFYTGAISHINRIFYRFPIPDSRLPTPDSLLPTPYSLSYIRNQI